MSNWQSAVVLLGMCFLLYVIGSIVFGKTGEQSKISNLEDHDFATMSYDNWSRRVSSQLRIDMAASYYYQNGNNITVLERDTLLENQMRDLHKQANKIVECTLQYAHMHVDKETGWPEPAFDYCINKLGL